MTHALRLLHDHRCLSIAQELVAANHYLHAPVDPRCRPLAYLITGEWTDTVLGCLIFGRPESTRCYDGALTYGSQADVAAGRAAYDRWEILNLSRVWLSRRIQQGGVWCRENFVPGFSDRRGTWRPSVASWAIRESLSTIGYDYLQAHPPVWVDMPYQLRAILSYCDTTKHKGTIYRASGWQLARRNERGIETWYTTQVAPLDNYEDQQIRKLARHSERSRRLRAKAQRAEQTRMGL